MIRIGENQNWSTNLQNYVNEAKEDVKHNDEICHSEKLVNYAQKHKLGLPIWEFEETATMVTARIRFIGEKFEGSDSDKNVAKNKAVIAALKEIQNKSVEAEPLQKLEESESKKQQKFRPLPLNLPQNQYEFGNSEISVKPSTSTQNTAVHISESTSNVITLD